MRAHELHTIGGNNIESSTTTINMSSPSFEEFRSKHKTMTHAMTVILFFTLVLLVSFAISIPLVFTVSTKSIQTSNSIRSATFNNNVLSRTSLHEPCTCGCPTIEPSLNDEDSNITSRIINGQTVRAHSWPWYIRLLAYDPEKETIQGCGATLLTQKHFLTAAHCVHGHVPPNIFLIAGQHTRARNLTASDIHYVKNVYVHEGFNGNAHNDLAIVTSEEPLRFDSYVSPICLANPTSPLLQPNEELVAIGFGTISNAPDNATFPDYLQQVIVKYVSTTNPNCSRIFGSNNALHPGQMCAGSPGRNVCSGDSGSALMRRRRLPNTETYFWEQIGIASLSKDCGWKTTWPDVYANVPYYYDWIMATINRAT